MENSEEEKKDIQNEAQNIVPNEEQPKEHFRKRKKKNSWFSY